MTSEAAAVPQPEDAEFLPAGRDVTWQDAPTGCPVTERAVRRWSGEVLLGNGQCIAGAFHCTAAAAETESLSDAQRIPGADVLEVQLIAYLCAHSKAGELRTDGGDAFRKFNRFWFSPLRSHSVSPVMLPVGRRLRAQTG